MGEIVSLAPALNYRAQLEHANRIIELALSEARMPVCSTKFGPESAVFLHLICQHRPSMPVVWVDTGYNNRATQAFAETVSALLDLNLRTFEPVGHRMRIPPRLDDEDHGRFVTEVKLQPFQRALAELKADAWFTSIRRYQTAHRERASLFASISAGLLKVSPMLDWTADTVERYRKEHGLPHGPECYDPTKGERFRECGLHTVV